MFGKNKFGGGYNVSGTSQNVSDAIKEQELTNREGIQAEKEVKLEEWQVNLAQATAEREASLAAVKKDLDISLASIQADLDVNMKKTNAGNAGLDSNQNFQKQMQELDITAKKNQGELVVNQQKIAVSQAFNMKKLDMQMKALELQYQDKSQQRQVNYQDKSEQRQVEYGERSEQLQTSAQLTIGAMDKVHDLSKMEMQYKGNAAMTALKKGGRSFRLSGNALDFGNTRAEAKKIGGFLQGFQQNQIGVNAFKQNEPARNNAIALPGPGDPFVDSDGEDESINDSNLYDMDLNMEMEEIKLEGELKMEKIKMDKEIELEKLKLEQQKNEIELKKLALLAKQA